MKIISINVNNFGGIHNKPLLNDFKLPTNVYDFNLWGEKVDNWRNQFHSLIMNNCNHIINLVKDFDIIFLHEVDTNCASWTLLHDSLSPFYNWKPANGIDKKIYKTGRKSISCVFIKKGITFQHSETNFSGMQRNIEIKIDDTTILGIHAPYEIDYWTKLITHYKTNKNMLLIGDLNVFSLGTKRREKFDELLSLGAKDLWLEQGESNQTPTANTNLRIDYALASSNMIKKGAHELILNSIRRSEYTDHAAIVVTI